MIEREVGKGCCTERIDRESVDLQRYKQGFITHPQCITTDSTVADLMDIKAKKGFTGTPVTATGKYRSKLLGMR